jgi:hypothetical protein
MEHDNVTNAAEAFTMHAGTHRGPVVYTYTYNAWIVQIVCRTLLKAAAAACLETGRKSVFEAQS